MKYPDDLRYTSEHEWIRIEGNEGVVGITDYAQDFLGDIVYVSLPDVGTRVTLGAPFGAIESVKAASELFSPCSGSVVARNEDLATAPEKVNGSPYEDGWIIRIELDDPHEAEDLMDADAYRAMLAANQS